jgi:hypothetical protein
VSKKHSPFFYSGFEIALLKTYGNVIPSEGLKKAEVEESVKKRDFSSQFIHL